VIIVDREAFRREIISKVPMHRNLVLVKKKSRSLEKRKCSVNVRGENRKGTDNFNLIVIKLESKSRNLQCKRQKAELK
jgi:hypothetical protein